MILTRRKRRDALMRKPFPGSWLAIIERNVPYYSCLPPERRRSLQGLVHVFLAEKRFEGCGGLEITDEIRITVAAQACVLLLGLRNGFYPKLVTILVYPHAYVAPVRRRFPDGSVMETSQVRVGETWSQGSLVLAWDEVKKSAYAVHDGHNVVFHEFAHQLDLEDGGADGVPLLPTRARYVAWARVLSREYESFIADIESHRSTLLDSYGAASPAEFFSVVTEFFFEMPRELKRLHPALYDQFKLFYGQDPASWPMSRC
jgi:Mlc titration factor MtfA (ptsG expression regulator)